MFVKILVLNTSLQLYRRTELQCGWLTMQRQLKKRGLKVIIAGAGGAAHLPGMLASITILPVIGVPIKSSNSIDGWDSILSILQMPNGIPVATVALNGAKNAGLLAVKILAVSNDELSAKVQAYKDELEKGVLEKVSLLSGNGWPNNFDQQ